MKSEQNLKSNSMMAREIIESNNYLTLSSCDLNNNPWSTPLYFAYDKKFNLFFISASDSVHSLNIQCNPKVSCSIFDSHAPVGEGDGVQIEGISEKLGFTDIPHALSIYFLRRFPSELERMLHLHFPTEYLGKSMFAFFRIKPYKVFKLDLTVKDVDKRIEVDLLGD